MPRKRIGPYGLLILFAAISGFAYGARTTGLFACQPVDRGSDKYIGICNVSNYGDYDHGAFWFGLEEHAVGAAKQATILFIGNSRMQFALSTSALDSWFNSRALKYYLLGFSHDETFQFVGPLLQKMKPRAEIYVINIDNFFDDRLTGPANTLMSDAESLNRYKQKRFWQAIHGRVCGLASGMCGHDLSFIRTRRNGAWEFQGDDLLAQRKFIDQPLFPDKSVDPGTVTHYESRAIEFLTTLDARPRCVILTNIPNLDTSAGTAQSLAERLELPLVAPEMGGLTTFDGSHLDPDSALRWSSVFVQALEPHIERCLQGSAT